MAKTIKFNLICDNKPIRTIDDLQDNFCIEDIFDYYENGLLLKWLKVRGYDKQAEEVSKIGEEESEKIISKLIEIFEIEKTDRELINEIFKVRIARGQKRSGDTRILYEDIAKYYKTDFESLMKNLIDKNTSIDIVKNNISQLIKNYGWVFQIGAKKIFYGVNGAVLNDRLNQQMLRYRKAKEEIDQVYEAVDDDLKKMQEKLEELTRVNESLMLENSALRARVNAVNVRPIIYQGEEEEFYPDEIKDVILSILDEVLANTEEKTRRADILEDLLENNSYQHLSENRKKKVKAIFKGYKNLSGSMRQELEELGITISGDGKHYKLTYKNDPRYMVTIGKTPSDGRAGNNTAALVNKTMM